MLGLKEKWRQRWNSSAVPFFFNIKWGVKNKSWLWSLYGLQPQYNYYIYILAFRQQLRYPWVLGKHFLRLIRPSILAASDALFSQIRSAPPPRSPRNTGPFIAVGGDRWRTVRSSENYRLQAQCVSTIHILDSGGDMPINAPYWFFPNSSDGRGCRRYQEDAVAR